MQYVCVCALMVIVVGRLWRVAVQYHGVLCAREQCPECDHCPVNGSTISTVYHHVPLSLRAPLPSPPTTHTNSQSFICRVSFILATGIAVKYNWGTCLLLLFIGSYKLVIIIEHVLYDFL